MTDGDCSVPGRALSVIAHPDDSEFGCAGTVAAWISAGCTVDYVVCTNGNKGTKNREANPHRLAEIREEEQRAAAELLGVRQIVFLRENDGELETGQAFRTRLAILIRHLKPDTIFAHDPWRPHSIHPDHRAAGFNTVDGVVYARDHLFLPELLLIGLEPHSPSQILMFGSDSPDYFVDITQTLDKKLLALSKHASQLSHVAGWEGRVREWATLNGQKLGVQYAEAFKRIVLR
jgi:LmbE family N-acetylglucosaminyl deacetylase